MSYWSKHNKTVLWSVSQESHCLLKFYCHFWLSQTIASGCLYYFSKKKVLMILRLCTKHAKLWFEDSSPLIINQNFEQKNLLIHLGTEVAIISLSTITQLTTITLCCCRKLFLSFIPFSNEKVHHMMARIFVDDIFNTFQIIMNDTTNVKFRADLEFPDKLVHLKHVAKIMYATCKTVSWVSKVQLTWGRGLFCASSF